MYPGAVLSICVLGEGLEEPYLVYTIDPNLLERCMSSNLNCQGGYTGQNDSGLHINAKTEVKTWIKP